MDKIDRRPPVGYSTAPQDYRIALRINEACTALGISRSSLYELIGAGKVRTSVVAGRRLIPVKELERLLFAGEQTSDGCR